MAKDHAPVTVLGPRDETLEAATDPQAAFDASVRAAEDVVQREPMGVDFGLAKDPCPRCGAKIERTIVTGGWSGLQVEGAKCTRPGCGYVAEPRYLGDPAKLRG